MASLRVSLAEELTLTVATLGFSSEIFCRFWGLDGEKDEEQSRFGVQFLQAIGTLRRKGLEVGLFDVQLVKYPFLRFISTNSESTYFTRDYLINTFGLSSQTALSAAQKIILKSTENPNSVLNLFKDYGLSKTQIRKLVSKYPMVLVSDPEKDLKPQMDLLESFGISDFAHFISSNPSALLEDQLANHEYLKSFLGADEDVWNVVKRSTWILKHNVEKLMGPNIGILSNLGVPKSNISKLLFNHPGKIAVKAERFNETVNVLKKMEFDPSSTAFIEAVGTLVKLSKATLEKKFMVYKELGWSNEEVLAMFRKQPCCMHASEKKIRRNVQFFKNVFKWKPREISLYVPILMLSMDKTILPRCAVLQVLKSAGVLSKFNVKSALELTEERFLEIYVTAYQEKVPDVVKAYQGEIRFTGFGKVDCMNKP